MMLVTKLDGSANSPSMLKVLVGMVLLAEKDWLYAISTPSIASPSRFFGDSRTAQNAQKKAIKAAQNYSVAPKNGMYPCLDLDLHLCDFQLSTARYSGIGSVVDASFLQESIDKPALPVMCKVVDVIRRDDLDDTLNSELCTYVALLDLQGKVIPRLYGYYNVWGTLDILVLEPVGHAVTEGQTITPALRELMKSIHAAGYLHGDIARHNFYIKQHRVFMVDLDMSRLGNEADKQAEMQLVDLL